jgi:HTH-type transcriptional regulator/antitoxin HigA
MNIKIINTEQEYNQALERLEVIFDAPAETPEGDEAELLVRLIENYENENYPVDMASFRKSPKF